MNKSSGFTLLELSLVIGVFALILFTVRPFMTYVMHDGARDAADLLVDAKGIIDTHSLLLRQNNDLDVLLNDALILKTPDELTISLGPGYYDESDETFEYLQIGGLGNTNVLSETISKENDGAFIMYSGYNTDFNPETSTDSMEAIQLVFGHRNGEVTIDFDTIFYWGNNNDAIFSP
jgi:type II secretory pathway pseudopilin PulG